MAEIVEEVVRAPVDPTPAERRGEVSIEVDGCRFAVSDGELTPAEARDLAESSRLVVWDSCGCGGGCGYKVWRGSEVSAFLKAGVPKVKDGWVLRIEDDQGRLGVLCEQAVRWGPLR